MSRHRVLQPPSASLLTPTAAHVASRLPASTAGGTSPRGTCARSVGRVADVADEVFRPPVATMQYRFHPEIMSLRPSGCIRAASNTALTAHAADLLAAGVEPDGPVDDDGDPAVVPRRFDSADASCQAGDAARTWEPATWAPVRRHATTPVLRQADGSVDATLAPIDPHEAWARASRELAANVGHPANGSVEKLNVTRPSVEEPAQSRPAGTGGG